MKESTLDIHRRISFSSKKLKNIGVMKKNTVSSWKFNEFRYLIQLIW